MRKIRKNKTVLIFIVVFGLLFFLHGIGVLRPIENFLITLIKPSASRLYTNGSNFRQSYDDKKTQVELTQEVANLKEEVASLTVANSQWQEVAEENKKLREQLKFISANKYQAVVASVISKESLADVEAASQNLVIDKGEKDGLRIGLGVIGEAGVIIGKVVEVKDKTARICLITSAECKLPAAIQNQTKTQGITDGDLGLTIKMSYIPQLEKITLGDIVITSGLGGNIPRGLVIGRVTQVKNESNDVWQEATIEPLLNFNNLTVLSVIIP